MMTCRQSAPEILTRNKMFRQREGSKGYFKSRDSHIRKSVCTDQTPIPWAQYGTEILGLEGRIIKRVLGQIKKSLSLQGLVP